MFEGLGAQRLLALFVAVWLLFNCPLPAPFSADQCSGLAAACRVAIIHPCKPRNPNEPGLGDLPERAKPLL